MFKFLRSNAKGFYWFIAITFVLSMAVLGLMSNGRPLFGGGNDDPGAEVLEVADGIEITAQEWFRYSQSYTQQQISQMQGREISQNTYVEMTEQAWRTLLVEKFLRKEAVERKLKIDDQDVIDGVLYNPPAEAVQVLQNQFPDRIASLADYQDLVRSDENVYRFVESLVKDRLPIMKVSQEITAAVQMDEGELREDYVRFSGSAVAEYVQLSFSQVQLDVEPADDALRAYYADHGDDFLIGERRSVNLVAFPKAPGEEDLAEITEMAERHRGLLNDGEVAFEQYYKTFSSTYAQDPVGLLEGVVEEDLPPEMAAVAFALPVGEIGGPVRTEQGVHLVEVVERFEDEGQPVRLDLRQIVYELRTSPGSLDARRLEAVAFRDRAVEEGFAETAEALGLEVVVTTPVYQGLDLGMGLRSTRQANAFAFHAENGDVSEVYQNDEMYYVVQLHEVVPEETRDFESVRAQLVERVKQEQRRAEAAEMLRPVADAARGGQTLAEAADALGYIHAVTDTVQISSNIAGVGTHEEFQDALIRTPLNEIADGVTTSSAAYVMQVLWRSEFDETAYQAMAANLSQYRLAEKREEVLNDWYESKTSENPIRYHWTDF